MFKIKEYKTLKELVHQHLYKQEDEKTLELIDKFKEIKSRGYFTKKEFFKMGMWKSPRPKHRYLRNSNDDVIAVSKSVLSFGESEIKKVQLLTMLSGVGVPTASAIQFLIDPVNYCVIDIRVWQVLYFYQVVTSKASGTNLKASDWVKYLKKMRVYAKYFQVTPRVIERTLFFYHKRNQIGNLYQ